MLKREREKSFEKKEREKSGKKRREKVFSEHLVNEKSILIYMCHNLKNKT